MPTSPPMDIPTIDPTPGPGDVTKFEQVKGKAPAPMPKLEPAKSVARPAEPTPAAEPAAPKGPKEIHLSQPSDMNRMGAVPEDIQAEIADLAEPTPGTKTKAEPKAAEAEIEEPAAEPTPAAEPAEEPAAPAAPTDDDQALEKHVQSFKTLKEVRTAHKEALKRERAWKAEQAELKRELDEAKGKLNGYDPEAVKASLAELEKSRQTLEEMEAKVRTLDYTKSKEWHEKYVTPMVKAMETAFSDMQEMLVTDENGQQRAATQADFKELVNMPLQAAIGKAKAMFGEASEHVLAHRRTVIGLKREQQNAMENASKLAEEARLKDTARETELVQKASTAYKTRTSEVTEKWPEIFKPRAGDEHGNKWLEKGYALVNALASDQLDPEQRARVEAEVHLRAASFSRVLFEREQARKEAAELRAELKKYQKSEPGEGEPTGGPKEGPADPMEAAMQEITKLGKPSARF